MQVMDTAKYAPDPPTQADLEIYPHLAKVCHSSSHHQRPIARQSVSVLVLFHAPLAEVLMQHA